MPQLGDKERAAAKDVAELITNVLILAKAYWQAVPGSTEETGARLRIKEVLEAGIIKLAEDAP